MLEAFKDKLQSVQQDLSTGIQKFKQRKSPSLYKFPTASTSSSALTSSLSSPCFLEPDAGSEILEHYRMCWSETHRLTEENIKAAQQCSEQLNRRQQQFRHQAISYLHLHKQATGLPSLAEQLSDLVAETANLQGLCEEVESSLAYLEVICDTQEFQEKKLDAKFNLALYREQKMAEMNERKACMTMNFLSRIESKAKDKALEQVEKQRLYQHAFEQDLNLYKATGLIANVKLEDSGIAGSDCQSVNGETDQDSPTEATPCDQYEKL